MKQLLQKLNPAVPKFVLFLIAGAMWSSVGIMLDTLPVQWLKNYQGQVWVFVVSGLLLAFIIHHFGFLKIVNKNIKRITELPEKACVFSFISWKSYLIIIIMITLGITLRHSTIPKQFLSIIYIGIGTALFLSSIRYYRKLFQL